MACNNSLTKQNNQPYKPQKRSASVHFNDVSEKSLKQDWQHKCTKCRQNKLAQKKHSNAITWQIDSQERLLVEIKNDLKKVLSIILDMQNIYTKYLNQSNKIDKKCDEICICILELEQELYISNEKREQAVFLLQQQIVKVKRYKKIIKLL